MNSNKFKEEGNKQFIKGNYKEAIELYSKAIEKSPHVSIFYTNRALCCMKMNQWNMCIDDCKHAIEYDPRSVKAFFYMGQSLIELYNYDEAIIYLKKSFDLSKEMNENYGDEISRQIRIAKRKRWNSIEEKIIQKEIELQSYLNRLMLEDKFKKISLIKKKSGLIEEEEEESKSVDMNQDDDYNEELHKSSSFASVSTSLPINNNLSSEGIDKINEIESDYEKSLNELNRLFSENDSRRRKREIPDYLCGKISFELMTGN
jgi:STIP1 homology and U-box containing protein 1